MPLTTPILQSDLPLFEQDNSARIVTILRTSAVWLKASDVLARLSLPDTEANRRAVRACAEHLGDELISGQDGYKHIDAASIAEVEHFYRWMHSQGEKMTARAARALARKRLPEPATI